MLAIVGFVVVIVCVFGGYLAEGGHLPILIQPIELMIIGGAAGGSLLISATGPLLKMIGYQSGRVFKGVETSKAEYTEVLLLLFELVKTAKQNLLGLEAHV